MHYRVCVPAEIQTGPVEDYGAVELFIQCAHRAQASYGMPVEDQSSIVRICQLVEGMPLGIELAAAWVPVLSCREIAEEIEGSLDFLTVSMCDREAELVGPCQKEALAELISEIDNLRFAWEWAVAQRQAVLLWETAWAVLLFISPE